MDKRLRGIAQRTARSAYNDEVEDRVVSPLANKVGGCATVIFIISFTGLGVAAAIVIARMGGDVDSVGPLAIGIGLLAGIVLGALTGTGVSRLLRRLLIR
ncbi:MAG: hypothetical protein ACOC7N_01125 [Chloroflexota bacterium]